MKAKTADEKKFILETNAITESQVIEHLLKIIGDSPDRGGLVETPARVLRAYREWFAGYKQDPKTILNTFEDGAEKYDQLVVARDIQVWSHCEHHLAPFFGVAHVAYLPDKRIVGLSKIDRLVDCFARRLQVQERLTSQIADALHEHLQPRGVGVVLECRHLCKESRGISRTGSVSTSALRGLLLDDASAKAEFLSFVSATRRV